MANAIVGTDIPPGVLTDDEARSLAAQLLKVVGARVREIRHSQGLSLNDVRDNLGIDASHISRMENGKMNLSPRALVRLAFIFIVRPWDFYLPDEKMRGFRPKRQTSPMPMTLACRGAFGHHLVMVKRREPTDVERMSFFAVAGAPDVYKHAAELEGLDVHSWIRIQLHEGLKRVWAEHNLKTPLPPAHFKRPPRLQPKMQLDPDPEDENR